LKITSADVDRRITAGIRDYFPNATYLLFPFHLNKRLRESLPGRKSQQKTINSLFLSKQIDEALAEIDKFLLVSPDPKEKSPWQSSIPTSPITARGSATR